MVDEYMNVWVGSMESIRGQDEPAHIIVHNLFIIHSEDLGRSI